MQHDWMIDVLSDLKTFATSHDMERLAEHLEDTILIAAQDMNVVDKGVTIRLNELSTHRLS